MNVANMSFKLIVFQVDHDYFFFPLQSIFLVQKFELCIKVNLSSQMYFSAYRSKEQFRYLIKSLVLFEVTRDTHGIHAMSHILQDLGWTLVHPAELRVSLCPWHAFACPSLF